MRDATTLVHLEALLVSLRDQLDHLTERVDARLSEQQLQLARLRRELSRLEGRAHPGPTVIRQPAAGVTSPR